MDDLIFAAEESRRIIEAVLDDLDGYVDHRRLAPLRRADGTLNVALRRARFSASSVRERCITEVERWHSNGTWYAITRGMIRDLLGQA